MSNLQEQKMQAERLNISSGGAYEAVFGYSRAVRIGNQIHVSGTCAPAGYEERSAYDQAGAALDIIEKALTEAGATLANVIRTVVYVTDMSIAEEVAKAHCQRFGTIRPASTLIQITSALRPWQKVEIEAYAVI